MKKLFLGLILAILLSLGATPVLAGHETSITGGGIIVDGHGRQAQKITFGFNIFVEGGQVSGNLEINFHNVYNPDLNKAKFKSVDIDDGINIQNHEQEVPGFTHVSLVAYGRLNGEDGWTVLIRANDYGEPGRAKPDTGNLWDAIRITLVNPSEETVFDTANEDFGYPREQSWRTLLDGGNMIFHY